MHNRLAVGQYAAGEREAALRSLHRAAELGPDWPLPHRNLAVAHRHRGDLDAAARARERADWLARSETGTGRSNF